MDNHFAPLTRELVLPKLYGYVLFVVVLTCFYALLIGFLGTAAYRKRYFTEDFMQNNFGTEHELITGSKIQKGGYPDMGSGRYTMKAGYQAWYLFNLGARTHANLMENLPQVVICLLIIGLWSPLTAIVMGTINLAMRLGYANAYTKDPSARIKWFMVLALNQLALPFVAIYGCVNM